MLDKRTGQDVLREPGNELVLQEEYAKHPRHGEGPWHLSPKGPGHASGSAPATVRAERCPAGSRIVAEFMLDGLSVTQETLLWDGTERVEFRTHVDGSIGSDHLLRVRFPADVAGGLPVYQTATAVIGRSFGAVDVDSADTWYTLDNPALGWFGLGSAARVRSGETSLRAIGVAEVIAPDDQNDYRSLLRDLLTSLAGAGVTATCSQADGPRYGAIDADSNLPDVRIALGGPDLNAFNSAVLAAVGPEYAKSLAAQLATSGTARVWVPAARSRTHAFAPNADLRGVRDLPVLVVAGTGPEELASAVRALIDDLADAVVEVAPADYPGGAETPSEVMLADRSVAIYNRGTPGCVVTPDGTLHMSLMRSCSAWPSGIWIDGDRRTAPDGSAFSLQHWSHTFEYALASAAGDWRQADFNAGAEDYGQDLIAVVTAGSGAVKPEVSLLAVEPANVTLSALKPHGNPLASNETVEPGPGPDGDQAVTVRLRETAGRPTTARIRLAGGVAAAYLTDLLEHDDGAPLPVTDGVVAVDMPPFGTVTAVLRVRADGVARAGSAVAEQVQPVYSRYWLHGKGPAPAGNLPVAVHLDPTRAALNAETGSAALTLTVASGPAGAAGEVELVVPDALVVSGPADLGYHLAGGAHAAWELTVRAAPGAAAGRYFVAARITDESGLRIEDAAMVAVGEKHWPDRELPPEEAMERMLADFSAAAAEVELAVRTPEVRLTPGGRGEMVVLVTSHLASELRGEALLVSPFGSWELLGSTSQSVTLAPGASTELRYEFRAPVTARPGSHWWALVKFMYFGRVWYTSSIPVTITGVSEP